MSYSEWAQIIGGLGAPTVGFLVWLWKKKIAPVHKQVKKIFAESSTNGGASMKDAIVRIEQTVSEIRDHLAANAHRLRTLLQQDVKPVFETDALGNFIWVNDAYIDLCGRLPHDIYQTGWLTHVAQDERTEVRDEWTACVAQLRDFDAEYTVCNHKRNQAYRVRGRAAVLRGLNGKVMGYLGTVETLRCLPSLPA